MLLNKWGTKIENNGGVTLKRDGSEKSFSEKKGGEHFNWGIWILRKRKVVKAIPRRSNYMCKHTEFERVCHFKGNF